MNPSDQAWLAAMEQQLRRKMPYAMEKARELDGIPYTTKGSAWQTGPFDGICWWTNGFWPGAMWLMYQMTGENCYLAEALRAEEMLDAAFADFDHLHHDVGFMWRLSAAASADLTGNAKSRTRAMLAATLLAGRYNPQGFIRAWNGEHTGWAIIDCMMNLSLLYWASEHSKDPRFGMIASRHADTAMQYFIREDGSCHHIVAFDPHTMAVLETPEGQGYASGSAWSRGQGWAMYGFMIAYRYTGKQAYLETARRVADFFLSRLAPDGIPDSDFCAPALPVHKDNVAGALAACALIDLAAALEEEFYQTQALHLLRSMERIDAVWSLDCPAIFQRCRASYHAPDYQTMQYGDFFFIEAIHKLQGGAYAMW